MSGYRAPDKDYLEANAVEPTRHHGDVTSELSTDEATGDFRAIDPHSGVKRGLKTRHLSMMALAGIIGPGLLVGSGGALSSGGPAALLIGFGTIGILAFSIMQSLGELTTLYPSGGAFTALADRFVDKAFGVAVGWNYFIICKRFVSLYFPICFLKNHDKHKWSPPSPSPKKASDPTSLRKGLLPRKPNL